EPARQIDAMESEKGRTASNFEHRQPEGDNRRRLVCRDCGFIQYENPKIVVGSVSQWQDRILLCRRAINPRQGYWTLPAGYLELNETSLQGAERQGRNRKERLTDRFRQRCLFEDWHLLASCREIGEVRDLPTSALVFRRLSSRRQVPARHELLSCPLLPA